MQRSFGCALWMHLTRLAVIAFAEPCAVQAEPSMSVEEIQQRAAALRQQAATGNERAALKEAAKQFESLFMRELLKSMREATQKSGLTDSEGEAMGTDLLDQQFAVQLSGMPGGLSEAIERQLARQMGGANGTNAVPCSRVQASRSPPASAPAPAARLAALPPALAPAAWLEAAPAAAPSRPAPGCCPIAAPPRQSCCRAV